MKLPHLTRTALLLALALGTTGCIGNLFSFNLFAVGEKTALEKQVLGTYEQLGRDLTVYASVRGVEPDGSMKEPPVSTTSQTAVVDALNNRRYNRDDLDTLLLAGAVGEGGDGTLVVRDESLLAASPLGEPLARQIVLEENTNRRTILDRLNATTPGITAADYPEVAWVFATLNHDLAPKGATLQLRDGTWVTK